MESSTIVIAPGQTVFDISHSEQQKWFNCWEMRYDRYEIEDNIRLASKKWDEDYLFSWETQKSSEEFDVLNYSDESSSSDSSGESDMEEDCYSE